MGTMSELVRDAIRHYHELLEARHTASTREGIERAGGRILRPHFLDRAAYEEVLSVTSLLHRGLLAAVERLTQDPALRRKLGLPEYLASVIEIDRDRGFPSMVGRFDALIDRSGVFKIIEYNASPGYNGVIPPAFLALPITEEFSKHYDFRPARLAGRLLDELQLRDGAAGSTRPAVLGVPVTAMPPPPEKYPPTTWAQSDDGRGCRVLEGTLDEFRYEGGRLFVERDRSAPIDVLVLSWDDLFEWAGTNNAVFDALRDGAVRALCGVSRGLLAGYKHTFELLSNPEYASFYEPEVAAALAKHVPWTRVLRNGKASYRGKTVDLLPFVADNRERWVLKPSGGSRGLGVVLGWRCTDAVWRQELKRAATQQYVVQERVLGSVEAFPVSSPSGNGFVLENNSPTCEPFIWSGTTVAEAIVRLSTTGNHTLGGGGAEVPLWVLDGKK